MYSVSLLLSLTQLIMPWKPFRNAEAGARIIQITHSQHKMFMMRKFSVANDNSETRLSSIETPGLAH